MGLLQDKYASVVTAAQGAGISNLQVQEQDGILYISGGANNTASKDAIWNALGAIDATYTASDININVDVVGLSVGASLKVITDSSNLNLRQEPSTEGALVGKAAHGGTVTLVEQTNSEWWKVKNEDGVEGFAYARYLQA
jgi:uncharacterized protein YgiM (DUF1202 family)